MSFWDGTRWVDDAQPAHRISPTTTLASVFWAFMLVVGLVGSSALPGPTLGSQPSLRVSPGSGWAGQTVTAAGANLPPRGRVLVVWDGSTEGLTAATVDPKGNLQVSFTVPPAADGVHTVGVTKATGKRQLLAWVSFTLMAASGPTPSPTTTAPIGTPAPGVTAAPGASPTIAPAPTLAPSAGPNPGGSPAPSPTAAPTATPKPAPTSTPTMAPTPAPTPATTARLLFGLGSQAESARVAPITQAAPIHMLSSWYNGPNDLGWMTDSWHRSIYQGAYSAGFALHLITWTPEPETTFAASTGTVCGRAYPLSAGWLDDMRRLAQAFAGPAAGPPLYVTLLTEFQTYPCIDNAWNANAEVNAYYRAMISQYEQAVAIFHQNAPNARVSLGWGGWQADWDDPAIGGGRSMIPYFATAMANSDFVSFQAMHGVSNVARIRAMTDVLGAYGPVMLAHHMPDADTNSLSTVYSTFLDDVTALLTPSSIAGLVGDGLFAWSFLDDKPMQASATTFSVVATGVTAFGR
jgi:hypothetical protein